MKSTIAFLAVLLIGCHGDQSNLKLDGDAHLSNFLANIWLDGADVIRILWRDCSKKLIDVKDVIDHKEYFPKFIRCMKRKTLRALDRSLSTDIVPLAEGVNLVRFEMVDKSGNVVGENDTSSWSEKELEEGEWRSLALQRMAKVLRTHVIKFDFDQSGKITETVEYRGRRRHQMMTMMMFGIVSIGMVLIPMGFQFLAVLGGKALLLAKMALILASIQGLKKVSTVDEYSDRHKIATAPVNYGFYHSYPPYDHFEQRSLKDWPQHSTTAATTARSMANLWSNMDPNAKQDKSTEKQESKSHRLQVTWRPELPKPVKKESEPRIYPVYDPDASPPFFTSMDAPLPLADLTTRPGDVQADYSIDLPYNGFHFQSPTPVVSA